MKEDYTQFILDVTGRTKYLICKDGHFYRIKKRFSEIWELHRKLDQLLPVKLPDFPPKKLFFNKKQEFLEVRMQKL